jgi:hypothetical protein
MSDVTMGNTQVGPTKQELISSLAQKELKAAAILAQYATDVSQFAVKGAKSVSFPKLTSFIVNERGSGAKGVAQAISSAVDTLALNVPAYIKWQIDPNDEIQSTLNWELETISRASSAHGRHFDTKVILESLATGVEASVVGLSKDLVLEGREYIKKNEGNLAETTLFVAPNMMTVLLKIEEFTRADIYGSANIPSGMIGKLYGMNVVEHTALADGEWYMSTKSAVAYAFQREPAYGEQEDLDLGVGAKKRAMDCLYGVKALQIGEANAPATKSPFIFRFKTPVIPE